MTYLLSITEKSNDPEYQGNVYKQFHLNWLNQNFENPEEYNGIKLIRSSFGIGLPYFSHIEFESEAEALAFILRWS